MAEAKKFYWLKLKRDFFKRHDIRIIEEMENGKDYILFYLKMLLESIDHEGELRFSETIPYDEKMLSVITNTNIDIVRSAMKVFVGLNMVEVLDDNTIYMAEVKKLTGCETEYAKKKREYRQKLLEAKQNEDKSETKKDNVRQEIEKEKELELKKDNKNNILSEFEALWKLYPRKFGKDKAFAYYQKARKSGVTYETVEQGIKSYCNYIIAAKVKKEFIKHGSTWFNNSCWNDDYDTDERGTEDGTVEKYDANSKFDEFFPNESYI